VQPYGHDFFYFTCIQGLWACPTCRQGISGWDLLQPVSTVSPVLLSLGNANDVALDLLLPKNPTKKKAHVTHSTTVETEAAAPDDTEYTNDEDTIQPGWQTWCDNEEYKNGGAHSISIDTSKEAQCYAKREEPVSQAKSKRPRMSKTLKTLGEIIASTFDPKQYPSTVVEPTRTTASPTAVKKKPGCPSTASKAQQASVKPNLHSLRSNVAMRIQPSRSIPRLHHTIPTKFRNLP
jgi:hypothetical protein